MCSRRNHPSASALIQYLVHERVGGGRARLVEEEELCVGGKGPHLGRDDGLCGVDERAHVHHGLQAQQARRVGLAQVVLAVVDGREAGLHLLGGRDEVSDAAHTRLLARRDDLLDDHVDHALGLDLDGAGVVLQLHVLPRLHLRLAHHAHVREELEVLGVCEAEGGLDAGVDAPHAAVGELLLLVGTVVVAVEDHLPVLVERGRRDILRLGALLNLVREGAERLRHDRLEHGVDHRHVLARAHGAELEARAAVGEGRRAVAVLSRHLEGGQHVCTHVEDFGGGRVLRLDARLVRLKVLGEVVAEVGADDGGGGLARAETEVVARRSNGGAHQVAVLVDSRHDGGHDDGEDLSRARSLRHLCDVEEVGAACRADAPVVVLARAVDVVERLLLQERSKSVCGGHLLDDLHGPHVLVDLGGHRAEQGRHLVLVGGDLAVAGAQGDAHLKRLALHVLDRVNGGLRQRERGHVVVAHLLPAGGVAPEHGASRHHQVEALHVRLAGDQEELLLEADVGLDARHVVAEGLKKTRALLAHRLRRAEQRRLLVEREAVVAHEARRDEDGVTAQRDGRGGVHRQVAARRVRGAQATVGVGGAIRLALEQILALEVPLGYSLLVEVDHHVLHLAGQAVAHSRGTQRLEPVAEGRRAAVGRPIAHGSRDLVGARLGPRVVVERIGGEAMGLEVGRGDGTLEEVLAEAIVDRGRRRE
mmetsp:Transcript_42136/g.103897  ORF Transcript_42136/g.103897 Transcript_42136/m.103897 type:complete len:704 (-) Transcript_42136:81-2192(-)